MQFVETTSKAVSAITIPEGEVIKVEEADTGRVLWKKNISKTYTFTLRAQNSLGYFDRKYTIVVEE